jgi:hypothetical protein
MKIYNRIKMLGFPEFCAGDKERASRLTDFDYSGSGTLHGFDDTFHSIQLRGIVVESLLSIEAA